MSDSGGLCVIAAVAENGVIGRGGALPWHLPDDLRRFRRLTTGHAVIMGRRTWDSIGGPLPRRMSIVVSRRPRPASVPPQVHWTSSLDEALAVAGDDPTPFVIGGAAIYALALPLAQRLYLTVVHADIDGDVRFPEFDEGQWRVVDAERHDAGDGNQFAFTYRTLERSVPGP